MKRLSDETYNMMKQNWPRACIDNIIRSNESGHILLSRRSINPYNGLWHFPGGGIIKGESFTDARNRILKAELGIKLGKSPYKIIGAMEFLEDGLLQDGSQAHSVSIAISFDISDKLIGLIRLNHEASEFAFFGKIPNEMHPIHQKFAEDYNIF